MSAMLELIADALPRWIQSDRERAASFVSRDLDLPAVVRVLDECRKTLDSSELFKDLPKWTRAEHKET